MSLASLKRALAKSRQERDAGNSRNVDWYGEQITITKLAADDGIELLAMSNGFAKAEDGTPTDAGELRKFFEFVVTRTVLEDDGTRAFESAEGRELLASMSLGALTDLGTLSLEWSGLDKSKKN